MPEVSMEALREAIINAFCHRDYRDPDFIQVAVYKNRVEIRNPGTLFGGLTIADLKRGHISRRRNPLIAELFRRIEMVEAWGRGMPLILENAPDVNFLETAGFFIAEFMRPSFREKAKETVKESERKAEGLAESQQRILLLVKENPGMSKREMAEKLGISTTAVDKNIATLKSKNLKNLLRRVGPDRGGRWQVLE